MARGSGIVAAHPMLDAFDHRASLGLLAHRVLRYSSTGTRHWFVFWPAIPEPVIYAPAFRDEETIDAIAA